MITTYYRDFYGCTASIKQGIRTSALLTVRTSSGQLICCKKYKTYKGARIALGKLSDGWQFVNQTGTTRIKL